MTNYSSIRYASSGTTVYADMNALIAATGTAGAQAFVQSNNNIYVYSGSGWYKIATVQNDSPSAITGVNGTYSLTTDGTPTVITAVSTDPEGFPLTWTYSTSGLGSIATVSQVDNVFTVTPSTNNANFGTFTLTINATDGVNGAVSANTSITLQFQILNSNYTTLLATAVNTSTNNIITDGSTNNHTISVNGDAHAGTFSPYRHGGYSAYFDGTDDYLSIANSTDFQILGGDFTVECWVYLTETQSNDGIIGIHNNSNNGWFIRTVDANTIRFWTSASSADRTYSMDTHKWYHIAVSSSSNVGTLYVNGSAVGSTFATNGTNNTGDNFQIGRTTTVANHFPGYITDVRIVKGTAVYTSAFTPPNEPLESIANTSLLACHLPYIADGSTNSHSITVNGDVFIKPFSPYDYEGYNAVNHGGSVYFDGTGDYLTVADDVSIDLSTGDFTLEAWIYLEVTSGNRLIIDRYTSGNNGSFQLYYRGTGNSIAFWTLADGVVAQDPSSSTIKANTWHHVVATRESGTVKIYVDGTQVATGACTTNFDSTLNLTIGAQISTSTNYLAGYISDVRIVKGTAVYTSDFTPPTAPLTAITNTSLLLSGADASIIDKSQNTNLKLIGNTTGSTTQVKFTDTKSMYFDGTGDYVNTTVDGGLGSGDFTLEFWFYRVSQGMMFNSRTNGVDADGIDIFGDGRVGTSGQYLLSGLGYNDFNVWYHIALVRSGTTFAGYIDGIFKSSITNSSNFSGSDFYIGGSPHGNVGYHGGYIQDFRLTKGLARYTANFTPPTEPLKG